MALPPSGRSRPPDVADGEKPWALSDFHITKELFRSGSGAVMLAQRRSDGQVVVLKERRSAELGVKEDILHEVNLLWGLSHPNIIRCYGYFWSSDISRSTLYIVLEYADAGDLYQEVQRRKTHGEYFTEEEVFDVFDQCCQGLQYLHDRSIVHRDIKTLNILRCRAPDGRLVVKLADLGVGRRMGQNTLVLQTFYGTPLYASPELCDNKQYTAKTDIWSLGVVLYELAALEPPFTGRSIMALAKVICRGEYAPLPSRYSRGLTRLIGTMLNVEHTQRPSAKRILGWLKDRPRASTSAPVEPAAPLPAPAPPSRDPAPHHHGVPVVRVRRREGEAAPPSRDRRASSGSDDAKSAVSSVLLPEEALQVRGGAPLLSAAQRHRLQNELKRRKVQAKRLEQALKAAVEHHGGTWDDVASEAGFTFMWESESAVGPSRLPSARGFSARSVPGIASDLDNLRRVHDDIFEIESQLSGRGKPTTSAHSSVRGPACAPTGAPAGAGHLPTGAGGGRYPDLPRVPRKDEVASPWPDAGPPRRPEAGGAAVEALSREFEGVAMSSRDQRWARRKAERSVRTGRGSAHSRAEPDSPESRRERVLLGRAGSEVVSSARGEPLFTDRTHGSSVSRAGSTSTRYNPITGAPM